LQKYCQGATMSDTINNAKTRTEQSNSQATNNPLGSKENMRKTVIIGTGIAGLTAAIYTARAELSPIVIGGPQEGGQLTLTSEVENFPGFEHGIDGNKLVADARAQATRFGAEFMSGWVSSVTQISENPQDGYKIEIVDKGPIYTRTIIIASGASARWLNIPSEAKYMGRGVSTCATCDGFFYRGKEVIVVGGGDSAIEEAIQLTKFATKVTIVHRRDEFRASKIMQQRAFNHPKIEIIWNAGVDEIVGDDMKVTGVKLKDTVTSAITHFACDGVFLGIGHVPNTKFVKGFIDMDEAGYIVADRFTHTNRDGIFAAGDVQDTRYRQAITAAGSGCASALEVEKYITEHFE
jgi:thioredoxin reductase (NADPH)